MNMATVRILELIFSELLKYTLPYQIAINLNSENFAISSRDQVLSARIESTQPQERTPPYAVIMIPNIARP